MGEAVVIYKMKQPVLLGILIIICGVALALWVLFAFLFPRLEGFWDLKLTVVVVLVALLVWSIVILIKHSSQKVPGLVIDDDGLTDNSNMLSVGFIPWADITEISLAKGDFNRDVYVIKIRNPQAYLEKAARYATSLQYQFKHFGSPIVINLVALDVGPRGLWTLLNERVNTK